MDKMFFFQNSWYLLLKLYSTISIFGDIQVKYITNLYIHKRNINAPTKSIKFENYWHDLKLAIEPFPKKMRRIIFDLLRLRGADLC